MSSQGSQNAEVSSSENLSHRVAAGIFQTNTAIATFYRLVNAIGTSKDTPDLRQKLHSTRQHVLTLVKNVSAKLKTLNDSLSVAERQGKYLAKFMNRIGKAGGGHANNAENVDMGDPFVYRHLGSMTTIGRYKALVDLKQSKEAKGLSLKGFPSWFIWRSAYLTRVISRRNRLYVAINWLTTLLFG